MKINIDEALINFTDKGYDFKDIECINVGKDSSVWKVVNNDQQFALKLYKENKQFASSRTLYQKYSRNRNYGKKLKTKGARVNPNNIRWEFNLINDLKKDGACLPSMFDYSGEALLMEYLGDKYRAPSLSNVVLSNTLALELFEKILSSIEIFLSNGIVHSDLTTDNVLIWDNKPYIIDFPQALDTRTTKNFSPFLKRDIDYMIIYFNTYLNFSPEDIEEIYKRFYVTKD